MLGSGHNSSTRALMGQVFSGRTMSKVEGGYLISCQKLPQGKGYVAEGNSLAIGSEILVKVIGQHQGMPLLHPVFAGFR